MQPTKLSDVAQRAVEELREGESQNTLVNYHSGRCADPFSETTPNSATASRHLTAFGAAALID